MFRAPLIAMAIAASLSQGTAAKADVINFSGSIVGPGGAQPDPSCAPIPNKGMVTNAPGTSIFGNITYSHTACTSGSLGGPVQGIFTINAGGDLLQGSFDGTVTPTGTPISNLFFTYLITGGTGQFLGATGSFYGIGTADLSKGPPATISLNFRAVPEPATWAMMLLGFGGIGLTVRRRAAPELRPA